MATIINNPSTGPVEPRDEGWASTLIGGIVVIILLLIFFFYGVPALRGRGSAAPSTAPSQNINVTVPNPTGQSSGGSGVTP